MAQVLYPTFLRDKEIYLQSRAFWQRLFDQLAQEHGLEFVPYLNDTPLEYDGNPIFNAWVPALGRGVRIIQVEPEAEAEEIRAWLDSLEIEVGQPPVEELVIDLVLSEATQAEAVRMIVLWIVEGLDTETMGKVIDKLP